MQRTSRLLPTLLVGLLGAVVGSLAMMFFTGNHFSGPGTQPIATSVSAAPLAEGGSDQERIVSAVKRVSPSVVSLFVSINGQQVAPPDPFSQMFGGQTGPQTRSYKGIASGSGWVYAKDGYIVTNAHVVVPSINERVSKIEVLFPNGDRVPAKLFSANVGADLALLKVDNYAKLPPPVSIGDSSRLQAGQWAIAIGAPFELSQTVTVGVVSGFNRNEPIQTETGEITFKGLLQTSAPINPGNSGGALIDDQGRLIGVNQSTANVRAGAQGIGFAIPANTVKTVVAELEKTPGTRQGTNMGFIGTVLTPVTPNLRVQLGYQGNGVAVMQVAAGSPADGAGLQPGDVILKINNQTVTAPEQLTSVIRATKPGDTVSLQVWSGGNKKLVSVKVAERPADAGIPQPQQTP